MTDTDSPFSLSNTFVDELAALRPTLATFWGVGGNDHRWDDLSPEGVSHAASRLRAWRDRAASLPPQGDRWSSLAAHVLGDAIDLELEAIDHGEPGMDLNTIASCSQYMRMAFDTMDASTQWGMENIASRMEALGPAFDGYRRTLEEGLARGQRVASRQVRAVVAQGRVNAGETSAFRGMPERLRGHGMTDPALARRVESAVPLACGAYAALSDWLEGEYLPRSAEADGVGRERYVRAMRRFLGARPDPEETCAWGWSEVRRIHGEMARLAEVIAPGESVPSVLSMLATDPARCAPDRATFLAVMRDRQLQALAALDGTHFDVPPEIRRIEVKEAPPGGPIGAYCIPPSEDFSRPGTVWYSMSGDGPFRLYDQVSTAYHEGFPGHHLQCGIQVSLTKKLSRLHRLAYGYSGFAEGWALYAEQLMQELGYYEKPEYELGMLANQMVRACRVAFDIGAHLGLPIPPDAIFHPGERWTFELGVEMMTTLGGLGRAHSESEVTRYLGWPAQAISYLVGQRAILALRDEFVGGGGGLRDFHSRVLACGNVGLDRLRAEVL